MLANLLSRIITALSHPGCAVLLSKYLICKLLSAEFSWNSINCQFFISHVIITQVALWMQFEEMIHSGGGYNGHTSHLLEKEYIQDKWLQQRINWGGQSFFLSFLQSFPSLFLQNIVNHSRVFQRMENQDSEIILDFIVRSPNNSIYQSCPLSDLPLGTTQALKRRSYNSTSLYYFSLLSVRKRYDTSAKKAIL